MAALGIENKVACLSLAKQLPGNLQGEVTPHTSQSPLALGPRASTTGSAA